MPISIHALLAESDGTGLTWLAPCFDFYPRSPCGERHTWQRGSRITYVISIHALLAESDTGGLFFLGRRKNFYPRSPCGERRNANLRRHRSNDNFYPRSPCGERLMMLSMAAILTVFLSTLSLRRATKCCFVILLAVLLFLSTLSLRRATPQWMIWSHRQLISIHALLAESDQMPLIRFSLAIFLSTLSLRRATCTSIGRP